MEKIIIYLPVLIYFIIAPETSTSIAGFIFILYPSIVEICYNNPINKQDLFYHTKKSFLCCLLFLVFCLIITAVYNHIVSWHTLVFTLFMVAIPEEYFFRYTYFKCHTVHQEPLNDSFRHLNPLSSNNNDACCLDIRRVKHQEIIFACLSNGLLFMVFHLAVEISVLNAITFFPGVILAFIYCQTKNFWLCSIVHAGMNLCFFAFLQKNITFLLPV